MTRDTPPLDLPDWPGLMKPEQAWAYTQLGEDSFKFVARKFGLLPVDLDLRATRYAKADLDRMIDSLPRRGAEMPDTPTANDLPAPNEADLALERARRRAGG